MFTSPPAGGSPGRLATPEPARPGRPDHEGPPVEQRPARAVLPISVTRIGTQVVVRPSGDLDDACAEGLAAAVREVEALALRRVVVDLDDVDRVEGAGLAFLTTLHGRWTLRLVNTPASLRGLLPRQAH
jgi:anti-anti-sigma regulatory factor